MGRCQTRESTSTDSEFHRFPNVLVKLILERFAGSFRKIMKGIIKNKYNFLNVLKIEFKKVV